MTEKRISTLSRSILAILLLLVGLAASAAMPAKALAANATASTWGELYEALQVDGNSITLTADVKFGEGGDDHASTALTVPASATVSLDLNGHVVNRGLTEAINWGQAIAVYGNLTVTDSAPTAEHDPAITYADPINAENTVTVNGGIITGGNVAKNSSSNNPYGGGGVLVGENATFTMQGGTICGNESKNNGSAVYVLKGGTFSMADDAAVCGNNSSAQQLSTVHLVGGTFSMSGNASISGNTGNGGVYATYAGSGSSCVAPSVVVNGKAAIRGNKGGGIAVYGDSSALGSLELSGSASVSDNTNAGVSVSSGTLTMKDDVTISGNRGVGVSVNGSDTTATLTGKVTISGNGHLAADNYEQINGGGLNVSNATVEIGGNVIIKDNKATCGGGIYANNAANVTVGGNAAIKDNTVSGGLNKGLGGGVYTYSSGYSYPTVTITDNAAISGNSANGRSDSSFSGQGGGVCARYGTLVLSGGSITNNTATVAGGGVMWRAGTTFRVSGSPVVTGNKVGSAADNASPYVDMYSGRRDYDSGCVITIASPLTEGASIGVTYGVPGSPVILTSGYDTYHSGVEATTFFSSDERACTVTLDEATGEVKLAAPETYSLWIAGKQVTELNCADVFDDGTVSYDPATATLTLDGYDSGADPGTWPVPQGSTYYNDTYTLNSSIANLTVKVVGSSAIRGAGTYPAGAFNAWAALFGGSSTIDIAEGVTLEFVGGTGVKSSARQGGICTSGGLTIIGKGSMNVRPANDEVDSGVMVNRGSFTIDGPDVTITAGRNQGSHCLYDSSPRVLSGSLTMDATAAGTYLMYRYDSVTAGEGLVIYLGGTEDTLQKQYGQSGTFMQAGYLKVCEPYMYDLWVAGVPVTKTNAADLTVIDGVDVASGGEARFDAETGTLYLKDATITNRKTGATDALSSGIYAEMDLRIEARGTNAVTATTEGSYWRTSGIGMQGYHQDTGAEYGLDIVLVDGATLTCTGGDAPDSAATNISSYGIYVNPANNAPVSVTGTGTLNAYGGTTGDMLYQSTGFAPGAYTQDGDVVVNAIGGDSARSIYGMYSNSAEIKSGTLVAEAIGAEGDHWSRGIYNNGTFTLSGGSVKATGGPTADSGDSYGFFKGQYGSLVITGGMLEAKTLATSGDHRALYYKVGYGMGDNVAVSPVKASVKADGTGAVAYVADNNDAYNWFMAPAVRTVSFDANGGAGTMAPAQAVHGEAYKLPACGFTAPANKEFDKWSAGAAGATITVNADLVLKAQWKAVVKTTLSGDITKAQKSPYVDAVKASTDGTDVPVSEKWVTPATKKALADALAAAKEVAANAHATQAQVDAAAKALEKAMAGYKPTAGKLCTVSFDANGGSGAMKAAQVVAGNMYELPGCGFTAPSGKQFDKWDKGAVGTKVKVAGNVTVKAVWKDKSTPKPEPEPEPQPGPEPEPEPQPEPAPVDTAWTRLAGDNAFKTMSAVIDAGSFEKGGTVVLASLEGYWDALTAAGIAGLEKAPVVMSLPEGLSPEAAAQLAKLAPKKIIVCGGTYWLPDALLAEAAAAAATSPEVVRLAGDNAALTAGKIAEAGKGRWSDTAIVATAGTFQDALAAAPVSYAKAMPIFLAQFDFAAERGYITPETIASMKAAGITQCYIAGGTYWLPAQVRTDLGKAGIEVLDQLGGESAVETSGLIAQLATSKLDMSADNMGAANVEQHYDALASAAFCGQKGSVLVLLRDSNRSVAETFVKPNASKISTGFVFGGTGSVSDASMKALEAASK